MSQRFALPLAVAVSIMTGLPGVGLISTTNGALAMGSTPPPSSVDCRKRKNKKKKECRNQQSGSLNDDQLYQAGYWLARAGKYEQALVQLRKAKNKEDPRILNYIGYSTRKLGRVAEAMTYYEKALSINPDYTVARAYLGEAFLEQGKLDLAKAQLGEIEKRCGQSCVEFAVLSGQIASFESTGKFQPQGKIDAKLGETDKTNQSG